MLSGCTAAGVYQQDNTLVEQQDNAAVGKDVRQATFRFEGMTCPSCAQGVAYQLQQVPGVITADVQYPEGTGVVQYDASQISADEIAVASTVYPAEVVQDNS